MHSSIAIFSGELKQVLLDIEAHCPVEYDGRMLGSMAAAMFQRAASEEGPTYCYTVPPEGYANPASIDLTCIHYGWFYPTPRSPQPELHIHLWRYQDSTGHERHIGRKNPCGPKN